MKHKRFDRSNWHRALSGTQIVRRLPGGVLADYRAGEVIRPLDVPLGGRTLRILDSGYRWVHLVPHGAHHAATVMLNAAGEPLQLYVDMTLEGGLDPDGIPFVTDLYLDVVAALCPDWTVSELQLKDEDEWAEVRQRGELGPEEAALAWAEAQAVMAALHTGTFAPLHTLKEYTRAPQSP